MKFSSVAYLFTWLSAATAVTIRGYASTSCDVLLNPVATCSNIASNTCCTFPRGGLQVSGAWFSVLYTATIGIFFQTSSTEYCATSRDAVAGRVFGACLTEGSLSNYFGGGAGWVDCTTCGTADDENTPRSISEEAMHEIVANATCIHTVTPTIFGWDGNGVWALKLDEGDDWDRYNTLPATHDMNEHIENLKSFGAQWYANPRDNAAAAEVLDGRD